MNDHSTGMLCRQIYIFLKGGNMCPFNTGSFRVKVIEALSKDGCCQ